MSHPERIRRGPLAVMLLTAATSLAASPPGVDWVRTWNGPAGGVDQGVGGCALPSGGFAMVGDEQAPGQGSNGAIRAYDSNGTLVWSRSWNSPADSDDTFWECAVNPSGIILGAGWETRNDLGEGTNWRMVAWNSAGVTQWTRSLDGGANGDDHCYDAAADSAGNFLIAGATTETAGGLDWMIRKVDAAGGLLWARTYNDPYNSADEATAVAVDAANNVVVAGWSVRSATFIHDWVIRKYDAAGSLLWSRTWGSPAASSDDRPLSVGTDAAGNVYAAGFESRSDLGQGQNWRVLKYDANGSLLLTASWNGIANGNDQAAGVVPLPDGGFIASGWESVSGQGNDWRVVRWDATGSILWSVTYNHPSNGDDYAWKLRRSAVEPDVLYVPGWEDSGTVDWRLAKLRQVASTALSGDLSLSATSLLVGSWFQSTLAVTNTGTGSAWTVGPSLTPAGTAPLTLISGPLPSTTTVEPGATRLFVWTWSCNGAGSLTLTASATGVDGGSFVATGIPGSVETAQVGGPDAALSISIVLSTTSPIAGDLLMVSVPVSNTGTGDCALVSPVLGLSGNAVLLPASGPVPGSWYLGAGSATVFVWTYSVTGEGTITISGSVTGTDVNTGLSLRTVIPVVTCQPWSPGRLTCATSILPAAPAVGSTFTVRCTVTNTGSTACTYVLPSIAVSGGSGTAWLLSGATPSSTITILPGSAQTFSWTYSATGPGSICLLTSASGTTYSGGFLPPFPVMVTATSTGCATIIVPAPPSPPEPINVGDVKIVGGVRGYINPKRGEQSTILVRPGESGPVVLRIYDRTGGLVREITEVATGGRTLVLHWDATDASGVTVPPGIYPALITGPGIRFTDKLAVLR